MELARQDGRERATDAAISTSANKRTKKRRNRRRLHPDTGTTEPGQRASKPGSLGVPLSLYAIMQTD